MKELKDLAGDEEECLHLVHYAQLPLDVEEHNLFLEKIVDLYRYMYGEYAEIEFLYWEGKTALFVNCNDLFFCGCDDAEEVTKDNIDILKECLEISLDYGSDLFCCRIRGMRPQGCLYSGIPEELHHHFDMCGPERIVDMDNPVDQRDWKNYRDGKPMEYPLIIEIKGLN